MYTVGPTDPAFWYVTAEMVGQRVLTGGVGWDERSALLTCLAEAAERYCASVVEPRRVVRATAQQLARAGRRTLNARSDAVSPDGRPYHCDSPFQPFDEQSARDWVEGESLLTGEPVWVPAHLVYLVYPNKGEQLWEMTSAGLAAGSTVDDATVRAVCELVEREAVMVTWLTRRPVARINLDAPGLDHAHEAAARHRTAGADLQVFDISTDLRLPATLAIARRDTGRPALAVGAACHPDPAQAATKAIMEAGHIHYLGKIMSRRYSTYRPPTDFSAIQTFESRALLYAHPALRSAVDFLWYSGLAAISPPPSPDAPTTPAALGNRLASFFIEAIRVEVTTPEIEKLGLKVVRVVAPQLQPMEANFRFRRFLPSRLVQWLPEGSPMPWWTALNPLPHPIA